MRLKKTSLHELPHEESATSGTIIDYCIRIASEIKGTVSREKFSN